MSTKNQTFFICLKNRFILIVLSIGKKGSNTFKLYLSHKQLFSALGAKRNALLNPSFLNLLCHL